MGEVYRVRGDGDEARRWYDRALELFGDGNHVGRSFYQRGLGDLALARGDHIAARRHFLVSHQEAGTINHDWQLIYALSGLARAALMAGARREARTYLVEALRTALEKDHLGGLASSILRGVVEYWLVNDHSAAYRLAALILAHPLTWRETRRDVARLMGIAYAEATPPKQTMFDLRPVVNEILLKIEDEAAATSGIPA